MIRSNDISSFQFEHERTLFSDDEVWVTYTTGRGDYYMALLKEKDEVLSKTMRSLRRKIKDIRELRDKVKNQNFHFRKNNLRIQTK